MTCFMSEDQVNEAFFAGGPLISKTILNLSVQAPSFYSDMYKAEPWPEGQGTLMEQHIYRDSMPAIEEGFDLWRTEGNNTGCAPCAGPDCSYNWSTVPGHALERKVTRLMSRDFKSNNYCVKTISNTYQFEAIFPQIIQGLYTKMRFQKEINIGQNALTMLAKKLVVDSEGIKANPENPWVYRAKGTATLSTLTIGILEHMYEILRTMTDVVPYDVVDGQPLYALSASPQLLSRLYRDDPTLRQDARFSSQADALLSKYNFQSTIRGMFFQVPFLWPRRFRYDSGNTQWVRVLQFINGVPAEAGTFSAINPQYVDQTYATHEEVLIHGKDPFTVWYQPTPTTIGEGTSFGPEPGFFDNWQWVNPMTKQDPGRREGFFWTHATIGISAQHSEGIFGILVPRPPPSTMVAFYPGQVCPPDAAVCTNTVPAVGCPVGPVLNVSINPVAPTQYFITFATPLTAAVSDVVLLGLKTGGFISGTVVSFSADHKTYGFTFTATPPTCLADGFVSVFVAPGESTACSSLVLSYQINAADATRIDLVLKQPIKAYTNGDVITLKYGNGTSVSATVISASGSNNLWTVDIGSSNFVDNVGGVYSICVPTATVASCPACGNVAVGTQCS